MADAEVASQLSHPNIVQLLGWAMLPSPVLVWPLLPRSLLSVLKDRLAALLLGGTRHVTCVAVMTTGHGSKPMVPF